MGKLTIEGSGDKQGRYLGFNLPYNSLMASHNGLEIWAAPPTQEGVGFGSAEDKSNSQIHRIIISFPLTDFFADGFVKHIQKNGNVKFTKVDLVNYIITFLEFTSKQVTGQVPEHIRDTISFRLEEMKKGPAEIHF